MGTYTPHPDRTSSRRSRPVPLVIGILVALAGFPLLLGGLGLGWAMATQRADDGFFSTPPEQLTTETVALSSEVVDFGDPDPDDGWADRDLATVRLSARSADASAVFIGIAPSTDVADYLDGASYDEVSDLRTDPFDYSLTRRGTGGDLSEAPTDQGFWTAQSSGPDTQTLTWDVEPGTYTAVVMNVDGSPGVTVDLSAGGRLDWLAPLAWGLGLLGGALVLGGALLVVYGASAPGPRDARRSALGQPPLAVRSDTPVALVGAKDPQLNRVLWLVKWFLAIPHFVVLALLWLVFLVLTVVAFLAILVTGRYPRGLFDLNVGILRWSWRVQFYATAAIGTDRYPPFTLGHTDYPADLDVAYPERLSRGLVLVKSWLLALPHLIVLSVLAGTWQFGDADGFHVAVGGLVGALTLAAGLLLLFTGRYPAPLFDLLVGLNRWVYRVIAYVALMTDTYPPFRLDQGPAESPAVVGDVD
ncbi:DUF4389 domain-containing protein [Janibacter cremeus]|uniref:DUF4389 domain-containing protein n=1 Tax=Janibacter cremeus TaxID=1285192 RepID=UPI0023F8942C|nr:DUF4389 domain-containing protein [Janibacter cremeus]WEV78168.1 DUF4389 domain-containing protein [Janibacter cremeus]WEV78248.1 DUF4389 domain-containing protein [Janibacter cremeus]